MKYSKALVAMVGSIAALTAANTARAAELRYNWAPIVQAGSYTPCTAAKDAVGRTNMAGTVKYVQTTWDTTWKILKVDVTTEACPGGTLPEALQFHLVDGLATDSTLYPVFLADAKPALLTKSNGLSITASSINAANQQKPFASSRTDNVLRNGWITDDKIINTRVFHFEVDAGRLPTGSGYSSRVSYSLNIFGGVQSTYDAKTGFPAFTAKTNTLVHALNHEVDKDCAGVYGGKKVLDACGVCDGNGTTCLDCKGVTNGGAKVDQCGVCGGDNSSCTDCSGVPNGSAKVDQCGVCGGDNTSCMDCDGIPNGSKKADSCGVCGGNGSSCVPSATPAPGQPSATPAPSTPSQPSATPAPGAIPAPGASGPNNACQTQSIQTLVDGLVARSEAQVRSIKSAARKVVKFAPPQIALKKLIGRSIARANDLHEAGVATRWSFPSTVTKCPETAQCSKTDLTPQHTAFLRSSEELRKIGRVIVAKLRGRLAPVSIQAKTSLLATIEASYRAAQTAEKVVPYSSSKCG